MSIEGPRFDLTNTDMQMTDESAENGLLTGESESQHRFARFNFAPELVGTLEAILRNPWQTMQNHFGTYGYLLSELSRDLRDVEEDDEDSRNINQLEYDMLMIQGIVDGGNQQSKRPPASEALTAILSKTTQAVRLSKPLDANMLFHLMMRQAIIEAREHPEITTTGPRSLISRLERAYAAASSELSMLPQDEAANEALERHYREKMHNNEATRHRLAQEYRTDEQQLKAFQKRREELSKAQKVQEPTPQDIPPVEG